MLSSLKEDNVLLNNDLEKEFNNRIEDEINFNNAVAIYKLLQTFKTLSLPNASVLYIERCFPYIVDCKSFLELDYISLAKILSSNELNIDSELEVYNAIVSWLGHNKERSKYAKSLLLKIRLSLLSLPALKYISDKVSCVIDDCSFTKELFPAKNDWSHAKSLKTASRYCNQNKFNIIVSVGRQKLFVMCLVSKQVILKF